VGDVGRTDDEDLVTDAERAMVRSMLIAAGHSPERAEWMAASCPSLTHARAVCNQDRRRDMRPVTPSPEAIAIRHAHGRLRDALGTPDEEARRADLQAAIDRAYEKSASAQERNLK
jgi:hypothetical protein